jgi:hypothetical protein
MSKPCNVCGASERNLSGRCLPCKREHNRKWRTKNKERHAAYNRRQYRKSPERKRETSREWQLANPEKVRVKSANRRTLRAGNGGSFTAYEWSKLCKQYNNHCCYPGCERTDLHADHVIPVSKGGTSDISNIQPLCSHHNLSKGTGTNDYRTKPGLLRWIQRKLF